MVCYNHEMFCLEALHALKAQSYTNIQLIIMDDNSSDNSVQLISDWIDNNFEETILIAHTSNVGLTKTLNEALSYVKGEYIAIISCDDKMLPTRIEDCVSLLEKTDERVGACVTDMIVFNEKSEVVKETYVDKELMHTFHNSNFLFEELIYNYHLPSPAIFYKKRVFDIIGNYDEELSVEDNDFLFRFSREFTIAFLDKPLVAYREHTSSFSKDLTDIKLVDSLFKATLKHVNFNKKNLKVQIGLQRLLTLALKRANRHGLGYKIKMYTLLFRKSKRKLFALNIIRKDFMKYMLR